MDTCVIVLTTLPADADAESFGRAFVDERLAACVNVLPAMQSIYRWQGAAETASERQIVIKTSEERIEDVKARIAALHPYEVPELLILHVMDGANAYLKWIEESTRV